MTVTNVSVPPLFFDGTSVDVLWDNHDAAVAWYRKFMSWEVAQQEPWKPDPRCAQGRMTRMNWGTWLVSGLSSVRLPHHYAERGTVDSHVRLCWRTRHLEQLHRRYQSEGVRVSDVYRGPGNTAYFDFWATCEGIRFTAQEDDSVREPFEPSWIRIGVSDVARSVRWYQQVMGMQLERDSDEDGYAIMSLRLSHRPDEKSLWVLEPLPEGAHVGKVDGAVRPVCRVADRERFFGYHAHLLDSGIETSDIGGYVTRGLVGFHFYDPDGNRMNISGL